MSNFLKAIQHGLKAAQSKANDLTIIRNGQKIGTVKGFVCGKDYPDTIQTLEPVEIYDGDILKLFNKEYLIVDAQPKIHENVLCYYMAKYKSNTENSIVSNTFNIGTVNSSIVGNQQNATMNFDNSITNLRDIISQKSEDKEQLEKFVNYLETLLENNAKIEKSNFEKFSDLLTKHSDIALAVGNTIFQWIIRK
jgi:hypothetical protein|nr:MAG TPA: hypothetical protein [Caudoviricetes sp.]